MIKKFEANKARLRRHQRIRRHLTGTLTRPRLNIFRSGNHIYAQIIDDTTGRTIVSASSLDESLRDFKPVQSTAPAPKAQPVETAAPVVQVEEPTGTKSKKASKAGTPPPKTALPAAPKREKKTPQEALAAIANNHKVSLAREVGKLVAQRAKEQGVTQVVFDRGGYAYHGRVAALAEGAREIGLAF
jgi:large subunit ribosomal protein L18